MIRHFALRHADTLCRKNLVNDLQFQCIAHSQAWTKHHNPEQFGRSKNKNGFSIKLLEGRKQTIVEYSNTISPPFSFKFKVSTAQLESIEAGGTFDPRDSCWQAVGVEQVKSSHSKSLLLLELEFCSLSIQNCCHTSCYCWHSRIGLQVKSVVPSVREPVASLSNVS